MNDIFQPLPFAGNGPEKPIEVKAAPRKRGPRRKAKVAKVKGRRGRPAKAQPIAVVEPKPAQGSKATVRVRKARTIKVELATAMEALAGLSQDDAKFLAGVMQSMQPFSKASRQRIVAALGKMVV